MKRFSTIVIPILVFLCAATTVIALDDPSRSDRWRGMVLDASTPDDAIRLFGTPTKDKDKVALDVPRPLSWLSDKCKEKLFRTITYNRIQEYKQVQFSFLNGKL